MKASRPTVVRNLIRLGMTFGMILNSASALANDVSVLTLSANNPSQSISLKGEVGHTLYRTEEYESTCSREEPYTVYRTECSYRTVEHCHQVPGGRSCSPSCREVTRQVCNSQGCRDVSTRECTESCTSEPSREVCSHSNEPYNCHNVPYIQYRTVYYSCTKTRSVPYGIEMDKILSADVTLRLTGDVINLTGKDSVKISIANGIDISRPDLTINAVDSADTHLLKITKSESTESLGGKQEHITAIYTIEAIPLDSVSTLKTIVTDIEATRSGVTVLTAGEAIDESTVVTVVSKKDRLLGGLKTDLQKTVAGKDLVVSNEGAGQKVAIEFGSCVNSRPHKMEVTVTRDPGKLLDGEILNTSAAEKAKAAMSSKLSKRFKFKDQKGSCSAGDSQQ